MQNQSFNIGPKKNLDKKVSQLIKLAKLNLKNLKFNIAEDKSKKEAKLLKLNCNKILKLTGWKPIYNFDETVKNTISWYQNFYSKEKNNLNYSINEIEKYVSTAKKRKSKMDRLKLYKNEIKKIAKVMFISMYKSLIF